MTPGARLASIMLKNTPSSAVDDEVVVYGGTGDPADGVVDSHGGGQSLASTQTALYLKQDAADVSDLLWFTTDGGTTWESINAGGIQSTTVSLTPAEIRAMESTPIELVAAPGAGKWLDFISCHMFLDFATVAHDDAAADGDLQVTYTDLAGEKVAGQEADTLIDAVADAHAYTANDGGAIPTADVATAANAALVISNDGAAYTGTGDSPLVVRTFYRVHTLAISV